MMEFQAIAKGLDLAQGFLEVMGGDIGKLLQFMVRTGQFLSLASLLF